MEVITVRTFDNYFYANLILTRLQHDGIECYLKDEHTVTIDPLLTNAVGGIKLVVKEADVDAANQLLEEYRQDYIKNAVCPKCSTNHFIEIAREEKGDFVARIFKKFMPGYTTPVKHIYQCSNCGYECETLPDAYGE